MQIFYVHDSAGLTFNKKQNQCTLFRRHPLFTVHFAAAVGKRMLREKMVQSSRATKKDHETSVGFQDREFDILKLHLVQNRKIITDNCRTLKDLPDPNELDYFFDYSGMIPNAHNSGSMEPMSVLGSAWLSVDNSRKRSRSNM